MVQVGLQQPEGSSQLPPPTGRFLYVGVGTFGRDVVQRAVRSLDKEYRTLPALTHTIVVDENTLPLKTEEDADRRQINEAFLQREMRDCVSDMLYAGLENCAAMLPMGQMPSGLSDVIHTFIVADLAESYGSALVLEISALLRVAAANRRHTLVGVLRLCPGPHQRARTFASLRELSDCFQNASEHCDAGDRDPDPTCFDRCFLVGKSNRRGELSGMDQTTLVARFLARFCRSDLAGVHTPVGGFTQDERSLLAAVGLSSSYVPRNGLASYCRRRWCEEVCEQLAASPDRSAQADVSDEQLWGSFPVPSVDDVYQALSTEASGHHLKISKRRTPIIRTFEKNSLTQRFRREWNRCQELCADLGRKMPSVASLVERTNSLASRLDNLVEKQVGGIHEAQCQLDTIHEKALARLDEAKKQHQAAQSKAGDLLAELEEQLHAVDVSLDVNPATATRPAWYDLIGHWERYLAIRQTRKELVAWQLETWERISASCMAMTEEVLWSTTSRAFEDFEARVSDELNRLVRLQAEIKSAPPIIEKEDRLESLSGIVVDHDVLSDSNQEEFYDHWLAKPIHETAARLLGSDGLLAGYRQLTAEKLARLLAPIVEERVKAIRAMPLRELLECAGLTPDYLELQAWLSHGLWDYAEPLTGLRGLPDSDADHVRADLAALQIPRLDSLSTASSPWPYSSSPPAVIEGADCSVHLCRIYQGFGLTALQDLDVWREAYVDNADCHRLHTVADPDRLPLLTV